MERYDKLRIVYENGVQIIVDLGKDAINISEALDIAMHKMKQNDMLIGDVLGTVYWVDFEEYKEK